MVNKYVFINAVKTQNCHLDNNENLILDEEYYEPDLTLEEACEMLDCENWDFYTKSNESIQPRTRKFINKHFN